MERDNIDTSSTDFSHECCGMPVCIGHSITCRNGLTTNTKPLIMAIEMWAATHIPCSTQSITVIEFQNVGISK